MFVIFTGATTLAITSIIIQGLTLNPTGGLDQLPPFVGLGLLFLFAYDGLTRQLREYVIPDEDVELRSEIASVRKKIVESSKRTARLELLDTYQKLLEKLFKKEKLHNDTA